MVYQRHGLLFPEPSKTLENKQKHSTGKGEIWPENGLRPRQKNSGKLAEGMGFVRTALLLNEVSEKSREIGNEVSEIFFEYCS